MDSPAASQPKHGSDDDSSSARARAGRSEAGASPRHVAFFASSLPVGAIQDVLVNLAVEFAARGHRVDLVTPRLDAEPSVPTPGVRLVDLDALSTRLPWFKRKRRRWLPSATPELTRYLRAEKPDSLLAGGLYANLPALWARRLAGVQTRIVLCEQNPLSRACRNPGRIRLLTPIWVRRSYPHADAIVACSGGVADDMTAFTGIPRERITAIHNPVVTPALLTRAEEPVEHPWLAPGEPPVILSVARLAVQKDFPTLIRAFARVRAQRPVRLLVLGEGRRRAELEALIAELGIAQDVTLPGFTENPLPYMKRAALFALSSIYEGFGNVLIEALACGCPVVSTASLGGPAEILEGGRYGRLVPTGDVAALAGAIEATLDAPPDPSVLQKRASEFSSERIADRYEQVMIPS